MVITSLITQKHELEDNINLLKLLHEDRKKIEENINNQDDKYKLISEERNSILEEKTNLEISLRYELEKIQNSQVELTKLKEEVSNINGLVENTLSDEEEKILQKYYEKEKQLEEIGIEVTVEKVSADKYGKYIEEKNYQILLTGVYTSYSPDLTYYFAGENISNYINEEMFELVQNAGIIKEDKQLKAIYEEIYKIYKEDVPFIGLYRNKKL